MVKIGKQYYLVIDAGTTYMKSFVYDEAFRLCSAVNHEIETIAPEDNHIEQDAEEYFKACLACMRQAVRDAKIAWDQIIAIGLSNQRATSLVWDRNGKPLCNAITWQDGRATALYEDVFSDDNCLYTDDLGRRGSSTPALALAWLKLNSPGIWEQVASGDAYWGTVDAWLVYKLTAGARYATSFSNVGVYSCYDCKNSRWHRPVMEQLGIWSETMRFPEILQDAELFGITEKGLFPEEIPICAVMADQQAELFAYGSKAGRETAKCTLSSGIFVGIHAGTGFRAAPRGLKNQNGWHVGAESVYMIEGQGGMAGSAQQWLRDQIGLFEDYEQISKAAASVPDAGGVVFVPALSGMLAPWWNGRTRGTIFGMTRSTTRAHMARALLEGIAFRVLDILSTAEAEGERTSLLLLGGGMTKSDIMCRILADVTGIPAEKSDLPDPSVMGALRMTAIGAAKFAGGPGEPELPPIRSVRYEPRTNSDERAVRYERWRISVKGAINWPDEI
jgi:glycerol kinase